MLRVESISFLVRTWFHCGHRGNRSCSELQEVSDVLCIVQGILLFSQDIPYMRIQDCIRLRGEKRREAEGQTIFNRLRKANFHDFAYGIHGTF